MAQPHLTLRTVPRREDASFGPAVTPRAACSLVLCRLGGIAFRDGGGEMSKRKGTHNSSTTTSSSPAAIIPDELGGQLESEVLDELERRVLTVALLENEGVCDGDVQQKIKNVFIKFSAFGSAAVVPPDLVSPVDAPHVCVVVVDGHGARHRKPCTILLAPEDSSRLRLAGGGHDGDDLPIHPSTCTHVAFLNSKELASIY